MNLVMARRARRWVAFAVVGVVLAGCSPSGSGSPSATGSSLPPATSPVSGWIALPDFVSTDGSVGGNLDAISVDNRVVIVGGLSGSQGFGPSPVFDLATRTWSKLNGPPGKVSWSSPWVWNGHEVLVFDYEAAAPGPSRRDMPINGFALDPRTGTWRAFKPSPPWDFEIQAAFWTGTAAVVTSSSGALGEGRRMVTYDPTNDAWSPTPELLVPPTSTPAPATMSYAIAFLPLPKPADAAAANALLVGAGDPALGVPPPPNPALWVLNLKGGNTPASPPGLVEAPFKPWELVPAGDRVAVFDYTHTKLVFWNPTDGTWSRTIEVPTGPRMSWQPRPPGPIAHWTGTQLVLWGGVGTPVPRPIINDGSRPHSTPPPESKPRADGAMYNPASDAWTLIADAPIARPTAAPFASIWAGDRLFAWTAEGSTIHAAEWIPQ